MRLNMMMMMMTTMMVVRVVAKVRVIRILMLVLLMLSLSQIMVWQRTYGYDGSGDDECDTCFTCSRMVVSSVGDLLRVLRVSLRVACRIWQSQ